MRKLNLRKEDYLLLLKLIKKYLPKSTFWAFGSRITEHARPSSDLDLVAFINPEDEPRLYALQEAFEESDLNIRVDVHNWKYLPENFKRQIETQHLLLYHADEPFLTSQ